MSCYICLDKCDNRSPCLCEAPIHLECLKQLRSHNRRNKIHDECSICKSRWSSRSDYFGLLLFGICTWFVLYGEKKSMVE
jgi:hypothetical protein